MAGLLSQPQSARTPEPKTVLTTITVELRDAAPTHGLTYGYVSQVFSAKERLCHQMVVKLARAADEIGSRTSGFFTKA